MINNKVTICIPTFNSEKTILNLLESITEQSFKFFNVIVSDNNSSDTTSEIVKIYSQLDERVKLINNNKNFGSTNNLIRLLDLVETDYFCWLPSDVFIDVFYLDELIKEIEKDKSIVGCYASTLLINKERRVLHTDNYQLTSDSTSERIISLISNLSLGTSVYGLYRTHCMKKILITPQSGLNAWIENKVFQFGDMILLALILTMGKIKQTNKTIISRHVDDNLNTSSHLDYFKKIENYQLLNFPVISLPYLFGWVKLRRLMIDSEMDEQDKFLVVRFIDKYLFNKYRSFFLLEIANMDRSIFIENNLCFSEYGNNLMRGKIGSETNLFTKKNALEKIKFDLVSSLVYTYDVEIRNALDDLIKKINKKIEEANNV